MLKHQFKNHAVSTKPWAFLVVFLITFFVIAVVLFVIDFVPESSTAQNTNVANASTVTLSASAPLASEPTTNTSLTRAETTYTASQSVANMPQRIVIPKVGIDISVNNPTQKDITSLDTALLKGAVRYPGSALLGENSGMFIFGHQSYLPVVRNQAFKAFNGLQNVRPGDAIIVSSQTIRYHYRAVSIDYVDVDTASIEIGGGAQTLTLVTCDSFGKEKTKRYVVHAEFLYEEPLTQ